MLHDKINRVARFAAAEAFINAFYRRNSERRCFFAVKRTKAEQISTALFQSNKLPDHFLYSCGINYLINGILRYHGALLGLIKVAILFMICLRGPAHVTVF